MVNETIKTLSIMAITAMFTVLLTFGAIIGLALVFSKPDVENIPDGCCVDTIYRHHNGRVDTIYEVSDISD